MSGAAGMQRTRAAFDLGGTFTDIVSVNETGELVATKVLSLPDRVGRDVRALLPGSGVPSLTLRHASTVASNAVIENRLAAVGLITTRGFRDVLEMRDQRRPPVIDAGWVRPDPLVPRDRRIEVDERILADGAVHQALDPDAARAAIEVLRAAGVQAIAVCLINSYVNPAHEQLIARIAGESAPEIATCISSDGFASIREYERTSTVTLNAALVPTICDYLDRLEEQLAIGPGELLVMKSNAGMMSSRAARRAPVRMIESGPAAGVLAAASYASAAGLGQVIAFDMGGTTAKASLIERGTPESRPRTEVGAEGTFASRLFGGAGHVVASPSLDIVEVGAGGGSIASVGTDGALHVGPQGAGADPGPACYGRGGSLCTVTDANVVLGYINPVSIAGGSVAIDYDAAVRAVEEQIARPLGLGRFEAALGIVRVADATMLRAIRAVSVERGRDARGATLIAYGGSGPAHAARLADSLAMEAVHVPQLCGLFSAVGLLLADRQSEAAHSGFRPVEEIDASWVQQTFAGLEDSVLSELEIDRRAPAGLTLHREADLQYRYEQATLTVSVPTSGSDAALRSALAEAFAQEHMRRFGFWAEEAIFLTALRVRARARARARATSSESQALGVAGSGPGRTGRRGRGRGAPARQRAGAPDRTAYFSGSGPVATSVCARSDLDREGAGGPLLIEEPDTVVVVPPGWRVALGQSGGLVLARDRGTPARGRA